VLGDFFLIIFISLSLYFIFLFFLFKKISHIKLGFYHMTEIL